MATKITVSVEQLTSIPKHDAPKLVDEKINELMQNINDLEKSKENPTHIAAQITELKEILQDGKVWQLPLIWKTGLAALTILFSVNTASRQIARGDGITSVLAWSAMRIGVTYSIFQGTIRAVQKWKPTRKCFGEIIAGDLTYSPFSRLTTIFFPFISRRLNGYDKNQINDQIKTLETQKNELPQKNELIQKQKHFFEKKIAVLEEFKGNYPDYFNKHVTNHPLHKRYSGRLEDIVFGSTDSDSIPIENDIDWTRALTRYTNKQPPFRTVDGKNITKLDNEEISALMIKNFTAFVKNIDQNNIMLNEFAKHHRVSLEDMSSDFTLECIEKILLGNESHEEYSRTSSEVIYEQFNFNLADTGDKNAQGFTPIKKKAESRLSSDTDKQQPIFLDDEPEEFSGLLQGKNAEISEPKVSQSTTLPQPFSSEEPEAQIAERSTSSKENTIQYLTNLHNKTPERKKKALVNRLLSKVRDGTISIENTRKELTENFTPSKLKQIHGYEEFLQVGAENLADKAEVFTKEEKAKKINALKKIIGEIKSNPDLAKEAKEILEEVKKNAPGTPRRVKAFKTKVEEHDMYSFLEF